MLRLPAAPAAALLVALIAIGSSAAPESSPDRPVTYLGEAVLVRCDLVVRATIVDRTAFGSGVTIATAEVLEVIQGREKRKRVPVVTHDPRVVAGDFTNGVLFLRRVKGSVQYEIVQQFRVLDDEGRARLVVLRQYVAAQSLPTQARRLARIREVHLENVASSNRWIRGNAIRELSWFTRRWPEIFTPADRRRFLGVREGLRDQSLRELLEGSIHRIDDALAARASDDPKKVPDADRDSKAVEAKAYAAALERTRAAIAANEAPVAAVDLLVRAWPRRAGPDLVPYLEDPGREIRERVAFLLGELEYAPATARLIEVLRREREDSDVRRYAIRSLGILGADAATVEIAARLGDRHLQRAAVYALAQIGSAKAKAALAALRERIAKETSVDDVRLRRLLDFVGSDAFARQEKELARIRARRRERGS